MGGDILTRAGEVANAISDAQPMTVVPTAVLVKAVMALESVTVAELPAAVHSLIHQSLPALKAALGLRHE